MLNNTSLTKLINEATMRLPELEGKLSSYNQEITRLLPKGLFRLTAGMKPASYIEEIKTDLVTLEKYHHENSGRYIARRIGEKINALVTICCFSQAKPKPQTVAKQYLQTICTRQQFLRTLAEEIRLLSSQANAIDLQLQKPSHSQQVVLKLKHELGRVRQRLTLAQEAFSSMQG